MLVLDFLKQPSKLSENEWKWNKYAKTDWYTCGTNRNI